MIRVLSSLALVLLCAGGEAALAQSVSGPAEAVDGDTLSLSGMMIDLAGIDAVERAQICTRGDIVWNCGEEARAKLAELVRDDWVACTGRTAEAPGAFRARCRVGSLDLAETMTLAGLALSAPDADADYSEVEGRAKEYSQGIWAGEFDQPSAWRAAHPQAVAKSAKARVAADKPKVYRNKFGCAIKGNQSYRGEWIYYLPGQPYYEETRPEALFCTEAAAQAAGYRPTRAR